MATILNQGYIVLGDRVLSPGSVVISGDRIADVTTGRTGAAGHDVLVDCSGAFVVPGFVDLHVHGAGGHDTLEGPGAVRTIAALLPRYGVTSFAPTSVACPPSLLARFLDAVRDSTTSPAPGHARVLPAHLESNFISERYKGAQPAECLRVAPSGGWADRRVRCAGREAPDEDFLARDILAVIDAAGPDVGIVTLAPELPNALAFVSALRARGHRVSLGHSGATYEQAHAAIAAGADRATHLFNRMPPLGHREPGLVGAVLADPSVVAELVCDGHHVHPAVLALTIRSLGRDRAMAITDGTSGAGLPPGSRLRLGGRPITVTEDAAYLDDGTLAGSTLTMDAAFRVLMDRVGVGLIDAVHLCATTPARSLGLTGLGVIAPGAIADLTVLDGRFEVLRTFIGGSQVFGPP